MVAHFADSWRDAAGERLPGTPVGWVLPTGEPLARYEIAFAGGRTKTVDVRRRFEIADGIIGWGFAAVRRRSATEPTRPLDWRGPYQRQAPGRYAPAGHGGALTILPGSWGADQTGVADFVPTPLDDATLLAPRHPAGRRGASRPGCGIVPLGLGRPGTDVVIAARDALRRDGRPARPGAASPGPRRGRRPASCRRSTSGWSSGPAPCRRRPTARTIGARPAGDIRRRPRTGPPTYARRRRVAGHRRARARAGRPDRHRGMGGRGRGHRRRRDTVPTGRLRIEPLPAADVRVEVHLSAARRGPARPGSGSSRRTGATSRRSATARRSTRGSTRTPAPASSSAGTRTPTSRRPSRSTCPSGAVEVEVVKGFDHRPVRTTVVVEPGDPRAGRSRSIARSTCGPRAGAPPTPTSTSSPPSTALLQAAAEDVTFVHLLATQLGDESRECSGPGRSARSRTRAGGTS